MAILVLDMFEVDDMPIQEWFQGCDEEVYIFTRAEVVDDYKKVGFSNVKGFKSYSNNSIIELETLELMKEKNIDKIFICDERDVIRGAKLRERFNIKGQSYESALAYRNKVIMKSYLVNHGLKVPPFMEIKSVYDVLKFVEIHGYPIIIKPIDLYAAINTVIIYSYNQLKEYCSEHELNNMMVEKYMQAEMVSCNGLIVNDKLNFICTTKYLKPRINYNDYLTAVTIPSDQSESILAEEYCKKVIKVLPSVGTSVFHSEIFIENGECYLCEIASRPAGGGITESVKCSYGIDLYKEWAQATFLKNYEFPKISDFRYSGSIIIPKKNGIIKKMVNSFPYEWVVEYRPMVKEGERIEDSKRNGDRVGTAIIVAESEELLLDRFVQIKKFVETNMIIEENAI